jgi:hypothetical protein
VFELANLVGVNLFEDEGNTHISWNISRIDDKLALLPQSVRSTAKVNDDF